MTDSIYEEGNASDGLEVVRSFIKSFAKSPVVDEEASNRRSIQAHADALRRQQREDNAARLKHRKLFALAMLVLLFGQNFAAFYLINKALDNGELKNLQEIFSIYTAATLTETAWVIRNIVRSVFGRIEYPRSSASKAQKSGSKENK